MSDHGWTHPKCERCWIVDNSTVLDQGGLEIRRPVRPVMLREADAQVCCFCGMLTIVGIFVRASPGQEYCALNDD